MELACVVATCTVCGTEAGNLDRKTGLPFRSAKGWCKSCTSRGGKLRVIEPCIDCGDPGGRTETRRGCTYIARIKGRCLTCKGRHYRGSAPGPRPKKKPAGNKRVVVRESKPVVAHDPGLPRFSWSDPPSAIAPWFLGGPTKSPEVESLDERQKRDRSKNWVRDYKRATRWWSAKMQGVCG